MKVSNALQGVTKLSVDTSALIHLAYGNPRSAEGWKSILSRVEKDQVSLVGSCVVIVEMLATQEAISDYATDVEEALALLDLLDLLDLNQEIAHTAAAIRRDYALATPDAIHFATAAHARCEAFLTADRDFLRVAGYPLPWAPTRTLNVILIQELSA